MTMLWLLFVLVAATSANYTPPFLRPGEGFISQEPEINMVDCAAHLSRWTECAATPESSPGRRNTDSLIHSFKLGTQHRQVQCRHKDTQFVELVYCKGIWNKGYTNGPDSRPCVMRVDCELGEWMPWRARYDGGLVRTRRVLTLPQGGGKECDVVQEVRPAVLETSAHWTPGPWGTCKVTIELPSTSPSNDDDDDAEDNDDAIYEEDDESDEGVTDSVASCGGGVQRREAKCVRADGRELLPVQCAHAPMPTLVQPCEVPCPRDCEVGEWGEWGACQPADGCPLYPVQQLTTTGYSMRSRRVTAAASGGGAPCPPLEEKRTCTTPRCAAWRALPWGPCVLNQPHSTCGPGRRSRELSCVGHDGKEAQRAWCNGSGAPARSERCRIACAGDCVVSAWGNWSPCSAECAAPSRPRPSRTRRRHILAHASPNGWPCPTEDQLVQNETCNAHACATYSWLATPWGPCERRKDDFIPSNNYTDLLDGEPFTESDDEEPCVEEGEMVRDVMCVQNNADVVREALCAPLRRPSSRRTCTIRCRRGCRVESWTPWSPCPTTCEANTQLRVRRVRGRPNCGVLQQTRVCPVPRGCRSGVAWAVGNWSWCHTPEHSCGGGYRTRHIWCVFNSRRVDAGMCAGLLMPPRVMPCRSNLPSCNSMITPPSCETICSNPLQFIDYWHENMPSCVCKNITLQLLPTDSDCILPLGMECGEGRSLRAARCLMGDRDVPMDICKKHHPLTGLYRVREAATDGFTYDEDFKSLLHGPCSVACARDCAVGVWTAWGPCASEPGSRAAFRFRTREVIQEGSGGGRECGATLQRATCDMPEPRWAVGEWAVCVPQMALCGRAIINRTVECVDGSGDILPEVLCASAGPKPVHEAPCRAPCPSDCVVSTWSEWSPCDQTKWGGRRDRTRVVLRPAEEGGAPCPHLVGAEPCAPNTYSWHVAPWDDCQPLGGSPCGEGTKKRSVRCLRSDGTFVEDSFCPNATASEARESWCYVPCGVDCELGEWGQWDESACVCGGDSTAGHMRRTRQHLTAAVWPGRACPPTEQHAPCPVEPCLRLVSKPTPGCHFISRAGDEIVDACGFGVGLSEASCVISSPTEEPMYMEPWRCAPTLPGRIVTPPLRYQEEEICEVDCGCQYLDKTPEGPWSPWGQCRNGTRSRTKQVVLPPRMMLCRSAQKFVGVEWANCSTDNDNNSEAWPGRSAGSMYNHVVSRPYAEVMVWLATSCLFLTGTFMGHLAIIRILRSRKFKSITKV